MESPVKKKSKRELFNEPSVESGFNEKIVKEEIEDFDSQTDFLGDEISDSLNIQGQSWQTGFFKLSCFLSFF